MVSPRIHQKTPFLCCCGWRGNMCSIVTALSAWHRTAKKNRFPQLSCCCVTSPQTRTRRVPLLWVNMAVVTWPGSRGNVFTELLPVNCSLCWLNYSGFQLTRHDKFRNQEHVGTRSQINAIGILSPIIYRCSSLKQIYKPQDLLILILHVQVYASPINLAPEQSWSMDHEDY
jgi:hypothetical protein